MSDPSKPPSEGEQQEALIRSLVDARTKTLLAEQKKTLDTLREGQSILATAESVARLGTWRWNLATKKLIWSDEMFRLFGIEKAGFDGDLERVISMRIHPADLPAVRQSNASVLQFQKPIPLEYRVVLPDGKERTVWAEGRLILDEQGRATALAGYVQDITERKKADIGLKVLLDALRSERDRAQAYFDLAGVILVVLDPEGRVARLNTRGCATLGYAPGELAGKDWFETCLPESNRTEARGFFRRLMAGEIAGLERVENEILDHAGKRRIVEWHNVLLRDAAGRVTGTLSSGEDVTERRLLESQLRQSQKMEAIGRLAGGIAHDFNNLLTVIIGNVDFLRESLDPTDARKKDADEIWAAADRASILTRQLLAFSRQQAMSPKPIGLNFILANLDKILRRLLREDIRFESRFDPDLGNVMADPHQIEQIVMNLAVNARDAMPKGGRLILETANAELRGAEPDRILGAPPGAYVRFSLQDTGIGMDESTKSLLFEPFFTTKTPGKGTGLGLSTVYGIVKQHKGEIRVESEQGLGTTFSIYLPRLESNAAAKADALPAPTAARGAETILLVEDEPGVLAITKKILGSFGYKVLAAESPLKALRMAIEEKAPFDLLLTDVVMPDMNGTVLARRLREARPGLKVLFMSGFTGDATSGTDVLPKDACFLPKPFTSETLSAKVRDVLDGPAA